NGVVIPRACQRHTDSRASRQSFAARGKDWYLASASLRPAQNRARKWCASSRDGRIPNVFPRSHRQPGQQRDAHHVEIAGKRRNAREGGRIGGSFHHSSLFSRQNPRSILILRTASTILLNVPNIRCGLKSSVQSWIRYRLEEATGFAAQAVPAQI